MKLFFAITGILVILFFVLQAFISAQVSQTEEHSYEILKKYPTFEVRRYAPALFTSVTLDSQTYKETSGTGFRILAGYIFGGNERGEKIAMTSPVVMQMDEQSKVMFMVPGGYTQSDLPKPNHEEIRFENRDPKTMAAITFGGWASDEKIEEHKLQLIEALEKEGLQYLGPFSYLGYNPPYEVVNRRNEVVVELLNYQQ